MAHSGVRERLVAVADLAEDYYGLIAEAAAEIPAGDPSEAEVAEFVERAKTAVAGITANRDAALEDLPIVYQTGTSEGTTGVLESCDS